MCRDLTVFSYGVRFLVVVDLAVVMVVVMAVVVDLAVVMVVVVLIRMVMVEVAVAAINSNLRILQLQLRRM
jgi:hypothetical protein